MRKEDDKKSLYAGPFSSTRDVESLLRTIRRIILLFTKKYLSRLASIIKLAYAIRARMTSDQVRNTVEISDGLFLFFWEGLAYY